MTNEEHIKAIVRETVQETLRGLGFDVDTPHSLQEDLSYLRKLRRNNDELWRLIVKVVVGVAIPVVLYLMWQSFKQTVNQ